MTARFAGSRSLDERRRRRLATEPEAGVAPPEPTVPGDAANDDREPDAARAAAVERAAASETWMPARAWKAWVLVVSIVALSAGAIFGGWLVDRNPAAVTPGLANLLGLERGRLVPALGSLWLLLAGQLALVVWWRRSRSTKDFEGRYDVWLWTAAGWFLFALAHETRAHLVWSECVASLWEPDFWNKSILGWFVPAVGIGGVLWLAARSDARRCRSGWWLLTLAGFAWVVAGLLVLGIGSVWIGPHRPLAIAATSLGGHALGLAAMLLHARFVTHVSNDPPVAKPRIRRDARSKAEGSDAAAPVIDAQADFAQADNAKPRSRRAAARRAPEKTATTKVAAAETKAAEAETTAELVAKSASNRAAASAHAPTPESQPRAEPPRETTRPVAGAFDADYDEADDEADELDGPPPEMLFGLSKRQKKKLRKEWRDRQRASRAA